MKHSFIILFLLISSKLILAQTENFAEVNGVKLYYEILGDGEPLVMLHGFTDTHVSWLPWVENLSSEFKVILVDLRGHGKSTNPTNEFSHKKSAEDIYGLMNHIGIEEFKAVGFSSGANTLIHMATMDTTRIKSMILIGATTYLPNEFRNALRNMTYENVSENQPEWMNYMREVHPGGEEQIRNLLNQFKNMAYTYEDMNFTSPYLSIINCPTLIIHGDKDSNFPVEIPINSYQSIPQSFLWIIPNFGHSVPQKGTTLGDLFIENITNFLTGQWN